VQTAATSPQMQRVSDAALCSREPGEFQALPPSPTQLSSIFSIQP